MRSLLSCIAACAFAALAAGCSPKAALIGALVPQSAVNAMLGNLERVSDENRRLVDALVREERWEALATLAERELAKDRANADWWLVKGYALSQLTRHRPAAEAYAEVVRLTPDDAAGWHLLAQTHRALGEPERAVRLLENARYALRDSPMTAFLLGESYGDLRRYDLALGAYRDALKIEQRFPAAWYALAVSAARIGRGAEAREAQARLAKLDPVMAGQLREAMAKEGLQP